MSKKQGRKPARRKPVKRRIDEDLACLAEVLAERVLENNAAGWFILPWRDGRNAVRLARAAWLHERGLLSQDQREADLILGGPMQRTSELYHRADDALQGLSSHPARAALRCLMIWIARSDGGGHVYNDILRPVFADATHTAVALSLSFVDSWRVLIESWRCQDALGLAPTLMGDRDDRYRQAFKIAWRRGLYHAAYSIMPVVYTP